MARARLQARAPARLSELDALIGRLRALVWMTWAGVILGLALVVVWIPRWGAPGAAAATLVAAVFGAVVRAVVLRGELGFRLTTIALRVRDITAFVRRRLAASPAETAESSASSETGRDGSAGQARGEPDRASPRPPGPA